MTSTTRNTTIVTIVTVLLSCSLLASPARAEVTHPSSAILAYGKVGGLIPVSKLGPHVSVRLGAGYLLPVLKRRLALVMDLGYSQSTTSDTIDDPRLGESGASYSYTMTQRDLNLFVGPQVFILDPFRWLVPYGALGLDLHFLRSVMEGEGNGEDLGGNDRWLQGRPGQRPGRQDRLRRRPVRDIHHLRRRCRPAGRRG